ncbi:LexA family protein [Companilactobacillus sp. DQM5]|uniref:LexA family protein n=1 Tax=Companilactobacillus sp. DQM5 TaxID=3463359 RepID=UPI004058A8DA
MNDLTEKQERFLAALNFLINDQCVEPTTSKLMKLMNIKTAQGILRYFKELKRKGVIIYVYGTPNKAVITKKGYEILGR